MTIAPVPEPPSTHPAYRADIDGLRAIAVLSVVASHAFARFVPGGFVGVDIFFVISGFLISTILFKSLHNHTFSYGDFYARRIRRIFPALIVILAACLIGGWFLLFTQEYSALGKHVAGGAGFIANFLYYHEAGYFDVTRDYKPLLHLWSLGVEEQYYLVWPVALSLLWRRRHAIPLLIGTVLVLSFVVNLYLTRENPDAAYYLPFSRFWELLIGALLALVSRKDGWGSATSAHGNAQVLWSTEMLSPLLAEWISTIGLLLLALALCLIDQSKPYPGWWGLLPTMGCAALIAAGPCTTINRRLLGSRPLVFIGVISYPLYLWHWPLLSFLKITTEDSMPVVRLAVVAISIVLAWLTFVFIERPIRSGHFRRSVPVLLCTMSVAGATGLLVLYFGGLGSRSLPKSKQALASMIERSLAMDGAIQGPLESGHCASLAIPESVKPYCQSRVVPGARSIVLWGDSHAGAWSPVFYQIGHELGLSVIVFQHPGCPPLVGIRRLDGAGHPPGCVGGGLGSDIARTIVNLRPLRVFLIARWSLYLAPGVIGRVGDNRSGEREPEASALATQLPKTVRALSEGPPVTIFRTTPTLKSDIARGLLRDFPVEPTVEEHVAAEAEANKAINDAVTVQKNADAFDPATVLCHVKCAAVLNGTLLYHDDNHVTAQGSYIFKDTLRRKYFDFGGGQF